MVFFFVAVAFMYIGRKVGWALSKGILYTNPTGMVVVISAMWGLAVALSMFGLIRWQNPNIILKIIMGYALGYYVAIPNFGLLDEATIPDHARSRHTIISTLPSLVYVVTMVIVSLSI